MVYDKGDGFADDFYVLSGPNAEESICITVYPPGTTWGSWGGDYDVGMREEVVFDVASMMLREMGWVDTGN